MEDGTGTSEKHPSQPEEGDSSGSTDYEISETDLSTTPERVNLKRTLPIVNVKEKIVIVLDRAEDEITTPFKLANSTIKPLEMLKRGIESFLRHKNRINKKHEFALMLLNENNVSWLFDFTTNINEIIKTLESIESCETEDIFNLNSLFDMFVHQVQIPNVCVLEDVIIPPSYVVRLVLFYGRSYTIPQIDSSPEIKEFLKSPYLTIDVLMTHEPIDDNNNCDKICNVFKNLDPNGYSYFFSVERDVNALLTSVGKLLGHPLQRPVQKLANYSMRQK